MIDFVGEHGEMILYGIVGVMMVFVVSVICFGTWRKIEPVYHTKLEKSNEDLEMEHQGKNPVIEADEVIYTDYRNRRFNIMDFIHAKDWDGTDLSRRVRVYGNVDVFCKGLYQLRCVVVSDSQRVCTKYVNVIVE